MATGERLLARARDGRLTCSPECKQKAVFAQRQKSAAQLAEYNRIHASERMKAKNPMKRPEVRKKVSEKLRAMNWAPPIRGGNGELTKPQIALAAALDWEMEVPITIPNSKWKCLKVDIGNRDLKVAIEVDGPSHSAISVKAKDRSKEQALAGIGWLVLRFKNKQVTEHLEDCVQMVLSTISKSQETITTSLTPS